MKIKILTYIDNKKSYEESYNGEYVEEKTKYIIEYCNNNLENFKIIIDKIKENVSIYKDTVETIVKYTKTKTIYKTLHGNIEIITQLVKWSKKERNNLLCFDIEYKIFFNDKDSQNNKLRIIIKK